MSSLEVKVPDVGVEGEVEIIEICIAVGDQLEVDAPIVVLETDKATVEVPCPETGKVKSIDVKVGDKVTEGSTLIQLEASGAETPAPESNSEPVLDETAPQEETTSVAETSSASSAVQTVPVPDLGGAEQVDIIEVSVAEGDEIGVDDILIVLETDKATMEIPSPFAGTITRLNVKVGDKVSEGDAIVEMQTEAAATQAPAPAKAPENITSAPPSDVKPASAKTEITHSATPSNANVHAGPAVRKLARELGADLSRVNATGPRNRILKEDLYSYIKTQVTQAQSGASGGATPVKELPDFSVFGDIEIKDMDKIQRVTAENMQTSWLTVPHVTQFDEADITKMEQFRKEQKAEGERRGVKLTPVAFLLKACAYVLRSMPQFNVSIDMQNAQIVQKNYVHIGIAVDTPSGLVVPVIRDVDKKQVWELAEECQTLALKAKERKLMPADMQGGCFTISSLGGIGGTAFTPIVNTPEVAILGLSKAQHKPVYNGESFDARLMLPLSLSYDHRAVNGADAARFTSMLVHVLGDLRQLLL